MGRVPDIMRRCFGLPTPGPEESTDGILFARLWLGNVLDAGEQAAAPLTWSTVFRLHPAVQAAAEGGLTIAPDEVVRALRIAGEIWSWSCLTEMAAEPGWLSDLLPEGAGGWMDEGILSRWLLASMSGIEALLTHVGPLITPAAARRLRRTLNRLDVLPERRPSTQSGPSGVISP